MYRINDHTYIDTTLITCAEYQLFTDEMRQQGKYFQPDHWISYQFPEDQAEAPILGVRPSDAIAFCDWLTQRESNEWRYRIPTLNEAEAYPAQALPIAPSAYWALSPTGVLEIFWITHVDSVKFVLNLDYIRDFDRDLKHVFDQTLNCNLKHALDKALNHEFDRAGNLVGNIFDRNFHSSLDDSSFAKFFDLTPTLDYAYAFARARKLIQTHDLELAYNLARIRDIARDIASDSVLMRRYALTNVSNFCDTALNLLLLKLRRQNAYPAFEGIRIVKERKPG